LNCSSVVGFERENKLKVSDNCFGIAHESKQLGAVAVELKNQAQKLLDQNPATHPVQDACARLLNLYIKYAESPDPSNRRENLISRIARTHGRLTEDDISHFEIKLGVAFPEDLRALLLAHEFIAHGGQRPNAVGVAPDIVANCNQLNELFKDGQNSEEDWSLWPGTRVPVMGTHLIPIGWGEPMLCYDLKPGPGGVVGQLVSVDIEDSTCKVEYPSLLAFLEESIREIEVMQKCF
jgi:cell wall assembly regulator SMI1